METPPRQSSSYPQHQVIPAENIMIQPSTPPSSAAYSLMLQQQSMQSGSSHHHHQQPSTSRVLSTGSRKAIAVSHHQMDGYKLKYMSLKKKCSGIQLVGLQIRIDLTCFHCFNDSVILVAREGKTHCCTVHEDKISRNY